MQRLCRLFVALPLLLAAASATASEDAAGCHDNPLFTRMPGYYIAGCESSEFDAVEMPVDLDENGDPVHTPLEGAVDYVTYGIRDGARVASPLQIVRNHLQAASAGGATVVKDFGARTGMLTDGWVNIQERMATLKVEKNGREFWVHLGSVNSGDYYAIGMVEVQAMKQDVAANELLDALEKDGFITLHVRFDTNKATIKPDSASALDQAADALRQAPGLAIEVGGHTDDVGAPDANQKLSEARAQAVVRALAERGISAHRMTARGYGQSVPIADNRSDDGRARNRRVELRRTTGGSAAAAPAPVARKVLEPQPRMGSQWGGCEYTSADEITAANMRSARALSVSIRPAREFDGTLDYHRTRGAVQAVPDLVGTAYTDAQMLLWQPPAKPWFVVVMVNQLGNFDTSRAVEAAREIRF